MCRSRQDSVAEAEVGAWRDERCVDGGSACVGAQWRDALEKSKTDIDGASAHGGRGLGGRCGTSMVG